MVPKISAEERGRFKASVDLALSSDFFKPSPSREASREGPGLGAPLDGQEGGGEDDSGRGDGG